jgi:four helix bundle protein
MNNFKELKVWQKSVDLATKVYLTTKLFPSEEKFGLVSQMNRSVVSIPSNIAEGAGRGSKKEFSNYLSIATGSSYELETQLIIAKNLNYINTQNINELSAILSEIQRMLYSLQKKLKTKE